MVEDIESGDVGFIDDKHDWGEDNEFWTIDDNGVFFVRKYKRRRVIPHAKGKGKSRGKRYRKRPWKENLEQVYATSILEEAA